MQLTLKINNVRGGFAMIPSGKPGVAPTKKPVINIQASNEDNSITATINGLDAANSSSLVVNATVAVSIA